MQSNYLNPAYLSQYRDIEEFLVSIYSGDENILNAAGSMYEILYSLNKALKNYNITLPELA